MPLLFLPSNPFKKISHCKVVLWTTFSNHISILVPCMLSLLSQGKGLSLVFLRYLEIVGLPCFTAQAVSLRPVTVETRWVRLQASPCGIYGEWSYTGTGFSSGTLLFPCYCHSTNAPYPFFHLSQTLNNHRNWQWLSTTHARVRMRRWQN